MAGLAAFVLVLVVALAGGWWLARDGEYVAQPRRPDAVTGSAPRVAPVVRALERAITSGDRDAAGSLGADEEASALLEAVVDNARALRLRDLELREVDTIGRSGADWQVAVDVTWAIAGFDDEAASTEVAVAVTPEGAISGIGGGERRTPLWLAGPLEVRRTAQVLVLGAEGAGIGQVFRQAVASVPTVRGVLDGWRPRLVVEVPATAEGLDRALGAEPGEYGAIAAVTAAPDGSVMPDAPLHVFANPEVLGGLREQGAQVVMAHETTHVATRAPLSALPLWLLEGFADYVALRDVDLPLTTTAGQVVEQVRKKGAPAALPGPAEFDTGTTHLGATYEAAWLACVVLAERGGERALVDFYRAADRGADLDAALRDAFGWTEADLTRAWRERLTDLAG